MKEDNDLEASKILQDLGLRWFAFGLGVGFVIMALLLGIII